MFLQEAEAEERVDGAHEPGVPGFEQRAQFLARCRLRVVVEQFNLKQVEQDVLLVAGQAFLFGVVVELVVGGLQGAPFVPQIGDDVFLRGDDELHHPVAEQGHVGAVQRELGVVERLVVLTFGVGYDGAERYRGGHAQMLAQLQCQQESPRPSVAVVERVDVFEGVVAHHGPEHRRYVRVGEQGYPFGELHLDLRFGVCAVVEFAPVAVVPHGDRSLSEQYAVRFVLVGYLAVGGLVVDVPDVLELVGQFELFAVLSGQSEEQFREFG